uniref:WH2 domain-containing protein n=1 Tax=Strongyloides stercoralis TaxID=6248 RepID=A0A0K0E0K7_STRER
MDNNINFTNTKISDVQHSFISPTTATPVTFNLAPNNDDNNKPKGVGLTEVVKALDVLMIAIREQFNNFREKLQQINVSHIVITAAKRLRGVVYQRFYLFFLRFIRRRNLYEDKNQLNLWRDNIIAERMKYENDYVGETLNDITDILLNESFFYDNSSFHKYQIHPIRFENCNLVDLRKESIIKENVIKKNNSEFDDKYSLQSGETGQISQITETEAFKKINEMEAEIFRLKEEMKKIMGLSSIQCNSKNEDNHKNSIKRPCSSLDDGISITSSQHSPIISPRANEVTTNFIPPPPPLPCLATLKSTTNKDKLVTSKSKCQKIEEVPINKQSDDAFNKMDSCILLNEIQKVKLRKVSMNEIKDRKSKMVLTPSECSDVGSFLQQALYEKFKNVKSDAVSDTDSDSELSLWSDDGNNLDTEIQDTI